MLLCQNYLIEAEKKNWHVKERNRFECSYSNAGRLVLLLHCCPPIHNICLQLSVHDDTLLHFSSSIYENFWQLFSESFASFLPDKRKTQHELEMLSACLPILTFK